MSRARRPVLVSAHDTAVRARVEPLDAIRLQGRR
jgi:hypothetical protein